jgi:hypothetical protein
VSSSKKLRSITAVLLQFAGKMRKPSWISESTKTLGHGTLERTTFKLGWLPIGWRTQETPQAPTPVRYIHMLVLLYSTNGPGIRAGDSAQVFLTRVEAC